MAEVPGISSAAPQGTKAEVGHEEAPSAGFPPFESANFAPQIIWLIIIFGALYMLMSRIALPRMEGILEARRLRISKDLDDATAMQQQADAANLAYEKTLGEARSRAQSMGQATREELHERTEAKRRALEEALNAKLAAAEEQIAATKNKAMANVGAIAREAAAAIVQHIIGTPAKAEAVEQALTEIEAGRGGEG